MSTSSRSLGQHVDQNADQHVDQHVDQHADLNVDPSADVDGGGDRQGIMTVLTWPRPDVLRWDMPPEGTTPEYLLAAFPSVHEALAGRTGVGMILGLEQVSIPRPAARGVIREQMTTLSASLRGVVMLVNANPLAGLMSGIGVYLMGSVPVPMTVTRDEEEALLWLKAGEACKGDEAAS